MKRFIQWVFTIGIVLLLASCASYQGGKQAEYSGFLKEYPSFEEGREGVDKVWLKPEVDWKPYDKIMLDAVQFFFNDQSEYKGLTAEELQELSDAYHKAFFDAMQEGYEFVGEPGPGVLRIRTAITGLEKSSPVTNTLSTVMPIGIGINMIAKGTTGENLTVGNISAEMELLDSGTNERLAAAVDFRPGSKMDGYTGLGAATGAFEFYAEGLRMRLDELRGIKTQ